MVEVDGGGRWWKYSLCEVPVKLVASMARAPLWGMGVEVEVWGRGRG